MSKLRTLFAWTLFAILYPFVWLYLKVRDAKDYERDDDDWKVSYEAHTHQPTKDAVWISVAGHRER